MVFDRTTDTAHSNLLIIVVSHRAKKSTLLLIPPSALYMVGGPTTVWFPIHHTVLNEPFVDGVDLNLLAAGESITDEQLEAAATVSLLRVSRLFLLDDDVSDSDRMHPIIAPRQAHVCRASTDATTDAAMARKAGAH